MDFEAEGLLDGIEGERARAARARLLSELLDERVPLEELRAAVVEQRLVLLPAERAMTGEARYTYPEMCERADLSPDEVHGLRQAMGLSQPDMDEPAFTDADVDTLRAARRFREAGLSPEGILEVTRVLGESMWRTAAAMRALVRDSVVRPDMDEREIARALAEAARYLTPSLGPLMEGALSLHMREGIRTDTLNQTELASGQPGIREVAVCFADLVGFTRLGEQVPVEELGTVAGRLAALATEVVEPPVRLVKTIGDAAMLTAPETDPMLDAALDLVEAAEEEGEGFPLLRAGVARGPVLTRGGDLYGRPVNLASRLTSIARPSSVLTTNEVCAAAGEGYRFSRAGMRQIKGLPGTVGLMRVRRAEPPAAGDGG